jgi:hypothetical protein
MPTKAIQSLSLPVLLTTIFTSVILYILAWAGADFMRSHDTNVQMPYIKQQLSTIALDIEAQNEKIDNQNMKMDTMMVFIGENRTDIRVVEATLKAKHP